MSSQKGQSITDQVLNLLLDAFDRLGMTWEDVHVVEDEFLAKFEEGRPVHVLLKCQPLHLPAGRQPEALDPRHRHLPGRGARLGGNGEMNKLNRDSLVFEFLFPPGLSSIIE